MFSFQTCNLQTQQILTSVISDWSSPLIDELFSLMPTIKGDNFIMPTYSIYYHNFPKGIYQVCHYKTEAAHVLTIQKLEPFVHHHLAFVLEKLQFLMIIKVNEKCFYSWPILIVLKMISLVCRTSWASSSAVYGKLLRKDASSISPLLFEVQGGGDKLPFVPMYMFKQT